MLGLITKPAGWVWRRVIGAPRLSGFESPMEERFWEEARRQGMELRPQYRVGPYRADFVVEPVEQYRVAVEIDGKNYHSDEDAVCRDYERDWYFLEQGWVVFRVRGRQVWRQPRQTVARLRQVVRRRQAARVVIER